jgi:hypothetical protein
MMSSYFDDQLAALQDGPMSHPLESISSMLGSEYSCSSLASMASLASCASAAALLENEQSVALTRTAAAAAGGATSVRHRLSASSSMTGSTWQQQGLGWQASLHMEATQTIDEDDEGEEEQQQQQHGNATVHDSVVVACNPDSGAVNLTESHGSASAAAAAVPSQDSEQKINSSSSSSLDIVSLDAVSAALEPAATAVTAAAAAAAQPHAVTTLRLDAAAAEDAPSGQQKPRETRKPAHLVVLADGCVPAAGQDIDSDAAVQQTVLSPHISCGMTLSIPSPTAELRCMDAAIAAIGSGDGSYMPRQLHSCPAGPAPNKAYLAPPSAAAAAAAAAGGAGVAFGSGGGAPGSLMSASMLHTGHMGALGASRFASSSNSTGVYEVQAIHWGRGVGGVHTHSVGGLGPLHNTPVAGLGGAAAAGACADGLTGILDLVRQLQGNLAGLESDMQQLHGALHRRSSTVDTGGGSGRHHHLEQQPEQQ